MPEFMRIQQQEMFVVHVLQEEQVPDKQMQGGEPNMRC
jgi:hypothetical protein